MSNKQTNLCSRETSCVRCANCAIRFITLPCRKFKNPDSHNPWINACSEESRHHYIHVYRYHMWVEELVKQFHSFCCIDVIKNNKPFHPHDLLLGENFNTTTKKTRYPEIGRAWGHMLLGYEFFDRYYVFSDIKSHGRDYFQVGVFDYQNDEGHWHYIKLFKKPFTFENMLRYVPYGSWGMSKIC